MAYRDTILATTGLVGYWRLSEASGTTTADEFGTNTGTVSNLNAYGTSGALVGDANTAFTFNGSSSKVDLSSINFQNASFSVEAWIRPAATPPSRQAVFTCMTARVAQQAVLILLSSTGAVTFSFYTNDFATSSGVVTFGGSYHHIVCTYDYPTDTSKIYVNGVLQATSSMGPMISTGGTTAIGYWNQTTPSDFFKGDIDEVAVYNTALSENDISGHYAVGLNLPPASALIGQQAVEAAVATTPEALIAQQVVETAVAYSPDALISQQVVEVAIDTNPDLLVYQQAAEVLAMPAAPDFLAYQQAVEVLQLRVDPTYLQVSQQAVEAAIVASIAPDLQVSQQVVEAAIVAPSPPDLQVSQQAVEVVILPSPVPPSSWAEIIG